LQEKNIALGCKDWMKEYKKCHYSYLSHQLPFQVKATWILLKKIEPIAELPNYDSKTSNNKRPGLFEN
jgi:hypothetical protein